MAINSSTRTPYTISMIRPDGVELVAKVRLSSDAHTMAAALAEITPVWASVRVETRDDVRDYPGTVEGMRAPIVEPESFTKLEADVLDAIAFNRVGFFDAGIVVGGNTWIDVLCEEMGDPKVFRGVVSSLVRKDVFESDGEAVFLTEAGVGAVLARRNA